MSVDTVRRLADEGQLATRRTPGGQRVIDGAGVAAYIAARPPESTDAPIAAGSARNRFPGVVTAVETDGIVAKVELRAGPYRIVSLMTAEAVDELGLAPGVAAVAAVKSTNVVVEVPTK